MFFDLSSYDLTISSYDSLAFLLITYLLCSIPFGLILSKIFAKKDIRQFGSKNIGATNVARILGKKLGLCTLILDGAKGAVMVVIAKLIFNDNQNLDLYLVLVAIIAVIGHIFPIYLKFKGGKGVATSLAVLLAINLELGLISCAVWLMIFSIGRISALASLGAIVAALSFAIYQQIAAEQIALCIILTILIFIRHKENIARLFNEEGQKR